MTGVALAVILVFICPCWCGAATGIDAIDFDRDDWEEEAERLLEWSETLDFDAYLSDWVGIGTSSHTMLTSAFRTAALPGLDEGIDGDGVGYK